MRKRKNIPSEDGPGSRLHDFDLALCNYLRGTIAGACFGSRPINTGIKDGRGRGGRHDGDFDYGRNEPADILAHVLKRDLPGELWKFISGDQPQSNSLLISSEEFQIITQVLEEVQELPRCDRLLWVPWQKAHRDYLFCLPEIRTTLAPSSAEEFARLSIDHVSKLNNKISLFAGAEIIERWVQASRGFLAAMGRTDLLPMPEGLQPTVLIYESVNVQVEPTTATSSPPLDHPRNRPIVQLLQSLKPGEGLTGQQIWSALQRNLPRIKENTLRKQHLSPLRHAKIISNTRGVGYHLPNGSKRAQ